MRKCNCGCGEYLTIIQRFLQKVDKTDKCWNWKGGLDKDGYGNFSVKRQGIRAHRWSYTWFVKEIPKGLVIDHLCRNKKCVNPKHLEPVTVRENIMRGDNFSSVNNKKTHCINGHELLGKNLYVHKKTGKRNCRECIRRSSRNWYKKKANIPTE